MEARLHPELLRDRARIVAAIRAWMEAHGYLEVHTPLLVPAGAMEPHLEPLRVADAELHTSPEFAMKRVLANGLSRIYQICPCFRAEESGPHHHREFTMLEWYRAGAGTQDLMAEVESLVGAAAQAIGKPPPAFRRVPVASLLPHALAPDDWFFRWVDQVEPTLTAPTIVYNYPPWQAALARVRGENADRFEVYLGGVELANAFCEELSSTELRARKRESDTIRAEHGRPPHPVDDAFFHAVDALPACAGIALGVDRLVMVLTGATSIAEVQVR